MKGEYFYSADSKHLVVPQQGKLRCGTELDMDDVEAQEITITPRGLVYRVEALEGPACGYVCENASFRSESAAMCWSDRLPRQTSPDQKQADPYKDQVCDEDITFPRDPANKQDPQEH